MSQSEQVDGLHPAAFTRADNTPDELFYAERPPGTLPDTLMDLGARTAVTALYQTSLPVGGDILDLMAGSFSHYPKDATFSSVVGLGIIKSALNDNPALTTRRVQDLNCQPTLPMDDESFHAVTLCDGLAYLIRPLEVLREAYRVLKPGAPLIVTFGDTFYPQKAVALWQALEPDDRSRLTTILLSQAGFTELDTGDVVPPEDLNAWQDTVHAVIGRRPRD